MTSPFDAERVLDINQGKAERDAGIDLVTENNDDWFDRAMGLLIKWRAVRDAHGLGEQTFLLEEFRAYALFEIERPRSPNAWGAFGMQARRARLIEGTGQFVRSAATRNHAHKYELLRFRRENDG
jgi:hypothetical protein